MTNAIPLFGAKWLSSSDAASYPPAEPPTPTMGQMESFVRLVCTDFFCLAWRTGTRVLLGVFVRLRAPSLPMRVVARFFAVRFEAMGVFYVNSGAQITQAVIATNSKGHLILLRWKATSGRLIANSVFCQM